MITKVNLDTAIQDIIKELELPQETQALGFVVHLIESDEFLVKSKEKKWAENRIWSVDPGLARTFPQRRAIKEAKKYGREDACVALLLDAGSQYIVQIALEPEDLVHYDIEGRLKKPQAVK